MLALHVPCLLNQISIDNLWILRYIFTLYTYKINSEIIYLIAFKIKPIVSA